jgi:hypothetical protein
MRGGLCPSGAWGAGETVECHCKGRCAGRMALHILAVDNTDSREETEDEADR